MVPIAKGARRCASRGRRSILPNVPRSVRLNATPNTPKRTPNRGNKQSAAMGDCGKTSIRITGPCPVTRRTARSATAAATITAWFELKRNSKWRRISSKTKRIPAIGALKAADRPAAAPAAMSAHRFPNANLRGSLTIAPSAPPYGPSVLRARGLHRNPAQSQRSRTWRAELSAIALRVRLRARPLLLESRCRPPLAQNDAPAPQRTRAKSPPIRSVRANSIQGAAREPDRASPYGRSASRPGTARRSARPPTSTPITVPSATTSSHSRLGSASPVSPGEESFVPKLKKLPR